jgi:hypothetical protein
MGVRLDSVEIKTTLAGSVSAAVDAFGLPADVPAWKIYFCEDVTPGTNPGAPLLDAGVILRVRSRSDDSDSTIKLRPGRQSQLTSEWLADSKLKVEADWAGDRKVLATSCSADVSADDIAAVAAGEKPVGLLFTDRQRRFLGQCADLRVELDAVALLPAVTATRWKAMHVTVDQVELSVRFERWTVDPTLDFLELSIAVDDLDPVPAGLRVASARQHALQQFVHSHGFDADATASNKTSAVVKALVAARLQRDEA